MSVTIREGDALEQRRYQSKPAETNPKGREHRTRQLDSKTTGAFAARFAALAGN
jgi:hypothetical protein